MTNSDIKSDFPINFQPMLKRFMVWDRHNEAFRVNNIDNTMVFNIATLISFFMYEAKCRAPYTEFNLVQSTNLFDKDGKEIWEGSIVKAFTNINKISDPELTNEEPVYEINLVELYNGAFRLSSKEYPHGCGILNNYSGAMAKDLEVVGHILSKPELLEER